MTPDHGTIQGMRSILRFVALLFVAALVATACSSTTTTSTTTDTADTAGTSDTEPAATAEPADEPEATDDPEPTAQPEATEAPEPTAEPEATEEPEQAAEPADDAASASTSGFASDEDFCRVARELDENDPFEDADIDPFSPEFFEAASELYDGLLAIAPDEIRADIALVRDELNLIFEQLEAIDFDFTNPAFGEVMESLDNGAVEEAATRIEIYLRDVCGIDVDAVDEVETEDIPSLGLDDEALAGLSDIGPEEAALLLGQLNLDPELQACLLEMLPELTASEDPAILTQEICGTTLLEIVSGLSG